MHDDIVLKHDEEHRWCLDCHDATDRDWLHLASGERVGFDESYRLCGQCHGEKLRDWKAGVHGRRTGEWNGRKTLPALRALPQPARAALQGARAEAGADPARATGGHPMKSLPVKNAPAGACASGCSRRQFASVAAAAAAGWLLTACGPKRLREMPKERLRQALDAMEREYAAEQGRAVTVADTPPLPGVLFGYALDLSRCIGCRRCVYACVEENNQSRDPQVHWIRVLQMEKEKGIDFTRRRPVLRAGRGPGGGPLLRAGRLPAVQERPLRQDLPDRGHLDGAGRHRGDRLRLVHRLPLLHGGLPLRRAPLQLGEADHPRRTSSTPRPTTWATGRARRASSRSAPSASSACGNGRYPACVEVCPVGARKFGNLLDPESEIRYIIEQQARPRPQGGAQHPAEVLLLLRNVRRSMTFARRFARFVRGSVRLVLRGNGLYWAWVALLAVLIASGVAAYAAQVTTGLIVTAMRDQVCWGFYIGNFTFLVGVAAAAVMLVIPAYVYDWKPIREIVIFGELLAISAIVMCLLFVLVDIGHPERFWHLIPPLGPPELPRSILAWDVVVLNVYFVVNFVVVTHILYRAFCGRHYDKRLVVPLVLLSIPMAVGIHTVTAFLYNGLAARPYWNSSILAPQFLASAFCSGPAILLVVLQLLRRFTRFEIQDEAIWKIAELMAYAMFLNLFLHGAEAFKEYYSDTEHLLYTRYWFQGLGEHRTLVPYAWTAVALNVAAFLLFIVPAARRNRVTLNLGCLAIYAGVLHREGHGAHHPGPDPRHPGRDLRVRPVRHRAAGGGRHLRRRLPGLHPDAQGRGPDLAGRVPGRALVPVRPRHRDRLERSLGGRSLECPSVGAAVSRLGRPGASDAGLQSGKGARPASARPRARGPPPRARRTVRFVRSKEGPCRNSARSS